MKYAGEIYGCGSDDASLRMRQRQFLSQLRPPKVAHESALTPLPRLEQGRWIVDCSCGSGAGISTEGRAYCFECGAVMTIALPPKEQRDAVADVLQARPETAKNWRPDRETIADLQAERAPR